MFNEVIVVEVTPFNGTTTPDKNGLMSVMLQLLAGKAPDRQTLSGTVAKMAGFEVGKTYLAQVRERGYHEIHGIDFTWTKIRELTDGVEISRCIKEWGPAELVHFGKPEASKEYQRKSDAIESQRTKDVKDGLYKPVQASSSTHHETAKEVKQGSIQQSSEDFLKNTGVNQAHPMQNKGEAGEIK